MKSKIDCDEEDLIFAFDCGCHVRESDVCDEIVGVKCPLHNTGKELLKELKNACRILRKEHYAVQSIAATIAMAEGKPA